MHILSFRTTIFFWFIIGNSFLIWHKKSYCGRPQTRRPSRLASSYGSRSAEGDGEPKPTTTIHKKFEQNPVKTPMYEEDCSSTQKLVENPEHKFKTNPLPIGCGKFDTRTTIRRRAPGSGDQKTSWRKMFPFRFGTNEN